MGVAPNSFSRPCSKSRSSGGGGSKALSFRHERIVGSRDRGSRGARWCWHVAHRVVGFRNIPRTVLLLTLLLLLLVLLLVLVLLLPQLVLLQPQLLLPLGLGMQLRQQGSCIRLSL
jgi:hypothetical protein